MAARHVQTWKRGSYADLRRDQQDQLVTTDHWVCVRPTRLFKVAFHSRWLVTIGTDLRQTGWRFTGMRRVTSTIIYLRRFLLFSFDGLALNLVRRMHRVDLGDENTIEAKQRGAVTLNYR